jgi:hypothetical protein
VTSITVVSDDVVVPVVDGLVNFILVEDELATEVEPGPTEEPREVLVIGRVARTITGENRVSLRVSGSAGGQITSSLNVVTYDTRKVVW